MFRKSGHLNRQKVLKEKLINGGATLEEELETGLYSAHDCANMLKSLLSELTEPLLTERHYRVYQQVPGLYQIPCFCFNNTTFCISTVYKIIQVHIR